MFGVFTLRLLLRKRLFFAECRNTVPHVVHDRAFTLTQAEQKDGSTVVLHVPWESVGLAC